MLIRTSTSCRGTFTPSPARLGSVFSSFPRSTSSRSYRCTGSATKALISYKAVGHYTTRHRTSTVGPHFRRRRMRKEEEKSLAVPIHPRPGIPAARLLAFTRTTWGYTREQVFGVLLTLSTVLVVAWGRLGKLIIKKLFWKAPPSPAVGTKIRILLRIPRKFLY